MILFIFLLLGLWLLALYLYLKAFTEWHDNKIRGVTKKAQKHKRWVEDINREFRKLDKVKSLAHKE